MRELYGVFRCFAFSLLLFSDFASTSFHLVSFSSDSITKMKFTSEFWLLFLVFLLFCLFAQHWKLYGHGKLVSFRWFFFVVSVRRLSFAHSFILLYIYLYFTYIRNSWNVNETNETKSPKWGVFFFASTQWNRRVCDDCMTWVPLGMKRNVWKRIYGKEIIIIMIQPSAPWIRCTCALRRTNCVRMRNKWIWSIVVVSKSKTEKTRNRKTARKFYVKRK